MRDHSRTRHIIGISGASSVGSCVKHKQLRLVEIYRQLRLPREIVLPVRVYTTIPEEFLNAATFIKVLRSATMTFAWRCVVQSDSSPSSGRIRFKLHCAEGVLHSTTDQSCRWLPSWNGLAHTLPTAPLLTIPSRVSCLSGISSVSTKKYSHSKCSDPWHFPEA